MFEAGNPESIQANCIPAAQYHIRAEIDLGASSAGMVTVTVSDRMGQGTLLVCSEIGSI
jgi:hypothetical protein